MTAISFPDCCVFDNSVIKRHSCSYSQAAPLLDMNANAFSWLTTRGPITIGRSSAYFLGLRSDDDAGSARDTDRSERLSYWWLNANPKIWSFEDTPVGSRQTYTSHNEKGLKRQKYRHFQDAKPSATVDHSDQGCQYTSIAFGLRCRKAGVRPSMGSTGDCYDNALCESFFATLECERLDRRNYRTQAEARMSVFQYIEGWYKPPSATLRTRISLSNELREDLQRCRPCSRLNRN